MKSLSDKDVDATVEFVRINSIENIAEKLLFILGFKSSLLGTRYIRDGIVNIYNQDFCSFRTLYEQIAKKYNTTYTCVERSIRHSISESHANGYLDRLNDLFRYQILDSKYPPTNSEFISAICTWVHIEKSQLENK